MTSTESRQAPPMAAADAVLDALTRRDFAQLAAAFEPDVVLGALLPRGFHEWAGPEQVTAAFVRWFGGADQFELVAATVTRHGPRLRMGWQARVRGGRFGDAPLVAEQHVYADVGPTGRIQAMALLCSGFTEEQLDV